MVNIAEACVYVDRELVDAEVPADLGVELRCQAEKLNGNVLSADKFQRNVPSYVLVSSR